jgi:hypothetical protein
VFVQCAPSEFQMKTRGGSIELQSTESPREQLLDTLSASLTISLPPSSLSLACSTLKFDLIRSKSA